MRVAGNSGSSLPHNNSSRRYATHSARMRRISSPTGKKNVVKVLLNLVWTSRASCSTLPAVMFFPEGQYRVYLYGQPADLRCSFDGLQALTRHAMGQDPLNGAL